MSEADGIEYLHIYAPKPATIIQQALQCPTCESEQKFICEWFEWFGWCNTCLNCGDAWEGGERYPRPFKPGWRQERIRQARKRFASRANDAFGMVIK